MSPASLLLERIGALIQQSVRDDAARHGLLPIHIQVLHYLAQANRYSDLPIAIAEYFGITRGTVSQTLAVLERKGLVLKQADPQHGKRVHLSLTTAGTSMLAASWAERVEQALATAPAPARAPARAAATPPALETSLRQLLVALQQVNGQRAFGQCRQCAFFLTEPLTHRCGLTGEALASEQTVRICREWKAPDPQPA